MTTIEKIIEYRTEIIAKVITCYCELKQPPIRTDTYNQALIKAHYMDEILKLIQEDET